MKISDFIPPILARPLKGLISSRFETLYPKFFSTYMEAQEACSDTGGYEDIRLVEIVFEKTRIAKAQMLNGKFLLSNPLTQSLVAVLFALKIGEKRLKVIDFGGACGAHYFLIRPFVPSNIRLDWVVVETPTMVEKAMTFETSELRFCKSLSVAREELQTVDLVHSSGTLQYVPDPQRVVQEIIACHPAYIFLNRLILSAGETFIAIQESLLSANGPGPMPDGFRDRLCRFPVTYFSERQLNEALSKNHQMKFSFAITKTLLGNNEIIGDVGMLLERSK